MIAFSPTYSSLPSHQSDRGTSCCISYIFFKVLRFSRELFLIFLESLVLFGTAAVSLYSPLDHCMWCRATKINMTLLLTLLELSIKTDLSGFPNLIFGLHSVWQPCFLRKATIGSCSWEKIHILQPIHESKHQTCILTNTTSSHTNKTPFC